jgi:hypothetical protein
VTYVARFIGRAVTYDRRVDLLRQDVGDVVHGMDEVHEQRIDMVDDGYGNGDLEEADHVQFLSFRCKQYRMETLRMGYGFKKYVMRVSAGHSI